MENLLEVNATKIENGLLLEEGEQNFTLEITVDEDGYYDIDIAYRHDRWEAYVEINVTHEDGEAYKFMQGLLHGKESMVFPMFLKKGRNTLMFSRHAKSKVLFFDVRNIGKTNSFSYEISPKNSVLFSESPKTLRTFIKNYRKKLIKIESENGSAIHFSCSVKDKTNGFSAGMIDICLSTNDILKLGEGVHKLSYTLEDSSVLTQNITIKNTPRDFKLKYINFDVGQANSTLIFLPNGKTMLIDSATDDMAEKKIIPYLAKKKIVIDYYLITHFHRDHQGLSDQIIKQNIMEIPDKRKVQNLVKKSKKKRYSYLKKFRYLDSSMLCCYDEIHKIWDLGGVKIEVTNSRYDESGKPQKEYHYSFIKENEHNYENSTSVSFMLDYNGFRYYHSADAYGYCQDRYMVDMIKQGKDAELNSHWFYANHHFINDINAKFINTLNPVGVYVPNSMVYHRAVYTHYYRENVSQYYFSHKRLKDTLVSQEVGNVKVCVNSADDWYYETIQDEDL